MKKYFLLFIPVLLLLFSQTCIAMEVTVQFDASGGTVSSSSMTYTVGEAYGVFPTAFKTGYDFNYWSDTEGRAVTTASIVTKATTLRAVYSAGFYKLYFNGNGGNCSKQYAVVEVGKPVGTLPVPTREGGYAFAGWSLTADYPYNYISADTLMPGNDTTVYAIWVQTVNDNNNATTQSHTIGEKVDAQTSKVVGRLKFKFKLNYKADGYQVRFSLKKNMKNSQKRTINANANIITISSTKIIPKKKYYVQVRAFKKKKNGKKIYGKWSAKKRFTATKAS